MASHNQEARQAKASEPESAAGGRGIERSPWTTGSLWSAAPGGGAGPFSMMRRLGEDMDKLFGEFFSWGTRGFGSSLAELSGWPEIEVQHTGNKLIVQADVPGLKREDVKVEAHENELTISGERKSESSTTEGPYYRTERSYGSFRRTVPLPEGAKPDTASATFENGVLKIEMEAPGGQVEARRIEVREGSQHH